MIQISSTCGSTRKGRKTSRLNQVAWATSRAISLAGASKAPVIGVTTRLLSSSARRSWLNSAT